LTSAWCWWLPVALVWTISCTSQLTTNMCKSSSRFLKSLNSSLDALSNYQNLTLKTLRPKNSMKSLKTKLSLYLSISMISRFLRLYFSIKVWANTFTQSLKLYLEGSFISLEWKS
jgi:hypothetical protein